MTVLRVFVNIQVGRSKLPNAPNIACLVRNLSSLQVSKNLELISKDQIETKVTNLRLTRPQHKPLVVLLSWLLAKRRYIHKYAKFYTESGFDVFNVSINPWQLLWPTKGTQVVAKDILTFLETNVSYSPVIVHGFSVGAYLWSEVLVQMAQNQERYRNVIDRIAGQVWDSAADITEIPVGVPLAVFPRNAVMQSALRQYIIYHMKAFDKVATCHYIRASQMFHTNIVKAPALFFISKSDPVGAVSSNTRARESWENMGIPITWKCWDNSPHVGHYQRHPEEYIAELSSFIDKIDIYQNKQKMQDKL